MVHRKRPNEFYSQVEAGTTSVGEDALFLWIDVMWDHGLGRPTARVEMTLAFLYPVAHQNKSQRFRTGTFKQLLSFSKRASPAAYMVAADTLALRCHKADMLCVYFSATLPTCDTTACYSNSSRSVSNIGSQSSRPQS
jgi:hypothetical protein